MALNKISHSTILVALIFFLNGCSSSNQESLKGKWKLYRIENSEHELPDTASYIDFIAYNQDNDYMFLELDQSYYPFEIPLFKPNEIWTNYQNLDYGDENILIAKIKQLKEDRLVLEFHVFAMYKKIGGGPLLYFKKE